MDLYRTPANTLSRFIGQPNMNLGAAQTRRRPDVAKPFLDRALWPKYQLGFARKS